MFEVQAAVLLLWYLLDLVSVKPVVSFGTHFLPSANKHVSKLEIR